MKKTYIQPQVEITELEAHNVIMASLSLGEDITSGTVSADAPELHDWSFFED